MNCPGLCLGPRIDYDWRAAHTALRTQSNAEKGIDGRTGGDRHARESVDRRDLR